MGKKWVRLTLLLFIAFIFLFFFFRKVDWTEVFKSLSNINILLFILVVLLTPTHYLLRALRWKYLLISEKREVKFSNMVAGTIIGFTVSFIFPGRIGELVRPIYLAQKENMSKGFAVGTIVVERVFDLFTMCVLLGVFLLFKPFYDFYFEGKERAFSVLVKLGIGALIAGIVLLALILLLYFFREKSLAVAAKILKILPSNITAVILKILDEFIQGLKFFHSIGNILVYALLSFTVWVGISIYYWLFLLAFRVSLPFVFSFPYTFFLVIGAAIPTPGMVGGFHYLSKIAFTSLFGLDANLAVGMTVVIHAVLYVVTCLMGYAIVWSESISLFQLKKMGEDARK